MGAEPWQYFVPYEPDIQAALEKLRQREFEAGRYRGGELRPRSVEEAFAKMGADGTASILDIVQVTKSPESCAVAPLPTSTLLELYDTAMPTRKMVEANQDFFETIERGQGVYLIVYQDDKPSEIFFAGYSFD